MRTDPPAIDAIAVEVLRNGLTQICDEVTITMLKTAHSVIFTEGKDLSTGVFDAVGRLLAQDTQGCPIHIAAMPQAIRAALDVYGADIAEGDVILVNDSFLGGTHLPDVTLLAPVVHEGERVGFVANRGHHGDVGGMTAGSMPGDATEMFQEGLILPPVRIRRGGEPCDDVLRIIGANVRLPAHTAGDLAAQMAGLQTGIRRMRSLLDRLGPAAFRAGIEEVLAYSERQMRREIAQIPDGDYRFHDYMDPLEGRHPEVRIEVTIRTRGSSIEFDFTGSDPQVDGAVNAVYGVTEAAVWIAMMLVTESDVHPSEGAFRPVRVTAPAGSVVNPRRPAATVSGLTETCPRIVDMCLAALAPGLPGRAVAGGLGTCNVHTLAGDGGGDGRWVAVLNPKGGWGAMAGRDGWTCIQEAHSNCRNQPCEALEHAYPLRVRRYALRTGGAGAGRTRGGYGLVRELEVLEDCVVSTCLDRSAIAPFGLLGGHPGAGNEVSVRPAGTTTWRPLAARGSNLPLAAGDALRIATAIGGGFGDPLQRPASAVADDVREGYLEAAEAARIYGVVLDGAGAVDEVASAARRRRPQPPPHEERTPSFTAAAAVS